MSTSEHRRKMNYSLTKRLNFTCRHHNVYSYLTVSDLTNDRSRAFLKCARRLEGFVNVS